MQDKTWSLNSEKKKNWKTIIFHGLSLGQGLNPTTIVNFGPHTQALPRSYILVVMDKHNQPLGTACS